jgi:hypothetical protein
MSLDVYNKKSRLHIEKFWHNNKKKEFVWKTGPISKAYKNFSVMEIEPLEKQEEWVYITIGASELHSPNHERLEFFILSPVQDKIHIDTLAMLANFHADFSYGGIYLGRVIEIGRPWMNNSSCEYFLVSLPYTIGKKFEHLQTDQFRIRFLWLLPITKNEADYIRKYNQEKLEEAFEKAEIEYLNPNRSSVV